MQTQLEWVPFATAPISQTGDRGVTARNAHMLLDATILEPKMATTNIVDGHDSLCLSTLRLYPVTTVVDRLIT